MKILLLLLVLSFTGETALFKVGEFDTKAECMMAEKDLSAYINFVNTDEIKDFTTLCVPEAPKAPEDLGAF